MPDGWSTPAGGGLHLGTDFDHDELDRVTQTIGPPHAVDGQTVRRASWTVYIDIDRETRSAQGFAIGSAHHEFDALGRQTQDRVTVLGVGVDGTVQRIETGYEAGGMRQRVTSFDSSMAVTESALPVPRPVRLAERISRPLAHGLETQPRPRGIRLLGSSSPCLIFVRQGGGRGGRIGGLPC